MRLSNATWRDCCRNDEPPDYWETDEDNREEHEQLLSDKAREAWQLIEDLPTADIERVIDMLRENIDGVMIGRKV